MKEEKQTIWETHFKIRKKTTQIQIKKKLSLPSNLQDVCA